MTKVSIGMPVYNGARLLPMALDALLSQEYADFELVIADNASTDDTPSICTAYARRDRRIRYTRNQQNIGGARNLQHVLGLATHDLFMWAAHDDMWHPECVKTCVEEMMRRENAVLCGVTALLISNAGAELGPYRDEDMNTAGLAKMERIAHVLAETKRNCLFYGLHRRQIISRLPMQTYYGFDHVWIAQLATFGEFVQRPECYFYSRLDGEGSSADTYNSNPGAGSPWFRYFPNLGLALHFYQAVADWPELTAAERRQVRRLVLRRFTSTPYPQRMLLDVALLPRRVRRALLARRAQRSSRSGETAG